MNTSTIKYAKTIDGVSIAYQVRGKGPIDLVDILGGPGCFEVEFEPSWSLHFLERLESFSRVVLFDPRGVGLSDRETRSPDLDMRADDLLAVLDAVESERSVLFGEADGGTLAALFAAMHPDRVLALVLFNSWARTMWAPDYPIGVSPEARAESRLEIEKNWATEELARQFLAWNTPSRASDPEWASWVAKEMRHGASPSEARAFEQFWDEIDIRGVLASVQAPTLVLSRSEYAFERSADLARRIPGARFVQLPGRDGLPYAGDVDALIAEIDRFVRSVSLEEASNDRLLTTVLFTDIFGSTERVAALGDSGWKDLLDRHHDTVRAMIGRYRGNEVDTAGDGFLATFDGPGRAVSCASAIAKAVSALGLEIRAGVHTGEVEVAGEHVRGLAVHIGARIATLASPGRVLVSSTVKDLVVGSGLAFEDAGEHQLKGVPDLWHLYQLAD